MKQYKFSLKDEAMKELSSMKEPKKFTAPESLWSDTQLDIYYGNLHEYKKHLASLQSIPVPKEYLNQFEDGKVYNEEEFEICKYQGETFVVPTTSEPIKDEELVKEFSKAINELNKSHLSEKCVEIAKQYTASKTKDLQKDLDLAISEIVKLQMNQITQ